VNRWEAREVIRRHWPQVAARLDRLDPLGDPPPPCTCHPYDMVELVNMGTLEPTYICSGACRRRGYQGARR
jgi:hypothetical protein